MKTKTIGILGLGSLSTLFYIKELNAKYHSIHGGYSTCPFKLLNTNFDDINNLLPKPSSNLDNVVKDYIDSLVKLNVDALLIPNITLHETLDRLSFKTQIIHPVNSTVLKIKASGISQIILFGSYYTMQADYIKDYFSKNNITILLPPKNDRYFIDEVRKEIYKDSSTASLLEDFNRLMHKYTKEFYVVLACTELSVAFNNKNQKVFDMSRIQIEKAFSETQEDTK